MEFCFTKGRTESTIDDKTLQGFDLGSPDYTYTGAGFGAGTGASVANHIIDDFKTWVADER